MEEKVQNETQLMLCKHFIKNIPYYIVLIYCLYLLSGDTLCSFKFINCIFTWIFICIFGYFTHVISHSVDLRKIYNSFDNIFTRNQYFNKGMNTFLKIYEFHNETHHNLEVNKDPKYIFYEFITNIYTQGIALIIFIEFVKLLNYKVILLWSLLYATIHNINYNIINPSVHRDHHIDCHTNYGIDVMDIIFNTKYDIDDIENFNHVIVNLIIITNILRFLVYPHNY